MHGCAELKEAQSLGKVEEGGQNPCGFVHGYRKLEGSSKGSSSHLKTRYEVSLCPYTWIETGTDSEAFGYMVQLPVTPMRFGAVRQQFVIWFLKYAALLSRPTKTKCSPFL
ncbi:hypothetical protein DPMN_168158 [Dreissena polymorpha]|uniref:Uncharacterized protein n=1 Tax=Dreissena polymorpha TaxID=45954 RepID=A0A9D4IVN7_DREPO|nr:hypothetical protein DPMN_168158 [Dreissena polymorpha]